LGALFHHLRDGLADRGLARITLEFRLESAVPGGAGAGGSKQFTKRGFRATLEYEDEVLRRAHLVSTAMSPRPLAEFHVSLHEGRYVYSLDGARHGLLIDTPRLYDVYSFESRLSRIAARDVILEEDPQPDGSVRNLLRVDVDDDAFRRLIHLFGDDVNAMHEELQEAGRSLVMTAGADVGIHYGWATVAHQRADGGRGVGETYGSRHSSRVSIRLEPLVHIGVEPVLLSSELPELAGIDDVWAYARGARAARSPLIGRQL